MVSSFGGNPCSVAVFFTGMALMSVQLGTYFQHKDKE